ncbi:MAG TPA: glycerate kinase [Sulfolobales archaeon]|nr:glycerate kinase [Sulfolobales archaeon]
MYVLNREELIHSDLHSDVIEILEEGLKAIDPENAIPERLKLSGKAIEIQGKRIELGERVIIAGFGKASVKMLHSIKRILGDLVSQSAVIAPREHSTEGKSPEIMFGEHPIPGRSTLESSERLLEILSQAGKGDTVILLISGGGSALFEIPLEGVGIEDIAKVTQLLLRSGATIEELNTVRKHLSAVKGGRLGKMLRERGARVIALIASDVIGDQLDTIASGPTVPDRSTYCDAQKILTRRLGGQDIPENVVRIIEKGCRGEIEETPKPGDPLLESIENIVIISSIDGLKAMRRACIAKGYRSLILSNMIEGEAREVGKALAGIAKTILSHGEPIEPPAIVLASGETTVKVTGKGVGGRNHELALSASLKLRGWEESIVASMGSDGIDGNSPGAGGIGDWKLLEEAEQKGMDLTEYLDNNDSYTALSRLGRSIYTGYTGTNVGDFIVIAARRKAK